MFLEHGSFGDLEIAIKKKTLSSHAQSKKGGWYTKSKLELVEGWTKKHVLICFAMVM